MKIRRGGVLREVETAFIFYLGARRRLRSIKQMRGGSLVTLASFVPAMTVGAFPSSVSGSVSTAGGPPVGVLTNTASASPVGGVAPYTYSWAITGPGSPSPRSPTSATSSFAATVPAGETYSATAIVTVTDATGQTATASVLAQFSHIDTN